MRAARAIVALTMMAALLAVATAGCSQGPAPAQPSLPPGKVFGPSDPPQNVLAKDGFVDPAIPRITAEELRLRLDQRQPIIIIDNRREEKFQMGHLRGAINIPYAIESLYAGAEDAMDNRLAALPDDALKVFYCD